jgi:hypothetical protein
MSLIDWFGVLFILRCGRLSLLRCGYHSLFSCLRDCWLQTQPWWLQNYISQDALQVETANEAQVEVEDCVLLGKALWRSQPTWEGSFLLVALIFLPEVRGWCTIWIGIISLRAEQSLRRSFRTCIKTLRCYILETIRDTKRQSLFTYLFKNR